MRYFGYVKRVIVMLLTRERAISVVHFDAIEPTTIREQLKNCFPDIEVVPRARFKLDCQFTEAVKAHQKRTTIRYTRNGVEYPEHDKLPLLEVASSCPEKVRYIGDMRIIGICYKQFGQLDDNDAKQDGFSSSRELKNKLCEFYGKINNSELVTIFSVEMTDAY